MEAMICRLRSLTRVSVAALALLFAACGSMAPQQFHGAQPRFEPEKFFLGPLHSWGVVENRFGSPKSRFRVDLVGRQEGDATAISQHFTYEDGHTDQREWRVRRLDEHRYEATSPSVAGVAHGEAWGNAFRWDYMLIVNPKNPLTHVHMSHWMYLVGQNTMVNRVVVSKLGVTVAEITEYFQRGEALLPSIKETP
jgi:hypothetical protein